MAASFIDISSPQHRSIEARAAVGSALLFRQFLIVLVSEVPKEPFELAQGLIALTEEGPIPCSSICVVTVIFPVYMWKFAVVLRGQRCRRLYGGAQHPWRRYHWLHCRRPCQAIALSPGTFPVLRPLFLAKGYYPIRCRECRCYY